MAFALFIFLTYIGASIDIRSATPTAQYLMLTEKENLMKRFKVKVRGENFLLNLDGEYSLDKINIYITQSAKGRFMIETRIDDTWQVVYAADTYETDRWYVIDLSDQNLATNQVRLTAEGTGGGIGGIGELELWGYGNYKGDTRQSISHETLKIVDEPSNFMFMGNPGVNRHLEFLVQGMQRFHQQ